MSPPRWQAALLAVATLCLPACQYSVGGLTRPGHRLIALPMFANETFYRDLEVQLTRQVARELASRPGMFIVPPERADIVLEGTIVDFRQQVISEDDSDRIRESSALTIVRIEIRDARDPTRVLRTFQIADRAEFLLARGESLATATDESFFDLARRVADGLESELPRASARTGGGSAESFPTPEKDTPDVRTQR